MPKNLLLVDDEPNIILSLEFLMKRAGYQVRTAADGEAAMHAVEEDPPDLILLDINMPKRDGFDVCQTIRANPDWKDIRIIILTAKGRDVEREKGMALGADDYITKPFATQDLVNRVNAILGTES
jgi:DNA-binding response OmpR family regulator